MPKNGQRRNRSRRRPTRTTGEIESQIKRLVNLQEQQLRFAQPNTLDVEFPPIKQHTYSFVVAYQSFVVASNSAAPSTLATSFSLSGLPNASAFTNLFDRYRILNIQLQFQPLNTTTTGTIVTAIDYDDSSTPTAELSQRDTGMTVPIGVYFERTFVPRLALAAYSGTFTSYANAPASMWLDAASPAIQYYGIKVYVPTASATVSAIYGVTARVHVQFKNNF